MEYLAQALKQTSREAPILLYTPALELASLDCCKFAVPLYPDSAHCSRDKSLLPVIQSSLIFARD